VKAEKKVDNPGSVEERLARVETLIEQHEDRLRKLENHLSDIQRELAKHSAFFKVLGGLGAATLAGVISVMVMLLFG